jgi:arylsulfatase A-like enzyme
LKKFGPRGVLKCKADGKGGQTIENTGPLTKKRMETIDDETVAAAKDFITRQAKAGKPFFCWWNGTRMHFRTHVKPKSTRHLRAGRIQRRHGRARHARRRTAQADRRPRPRRQHDRQYSTDNGPHYNTWPDAGTTPFRSEKNSNWEGAYRVPCFVRWPGHFPPARRSTASSRTKTGCRPSPPPPARPTSRKSLLKGGVLNGRTTRTTSTATTCSTT